MAEKEDEQKGTCDREGCNNPGSFGCSRCQTVRFCSIDCQKATWLDHKQQCFFYPPSPTTLQEYAKSDKFPGENSLQKENVKKLTAKIMKNARWVRTLDDFELAVKVLMDATRALVVISIDKKQAFSNQDAWDAFNSSTGDPNESNAENSWRAVATSWTKLVEHVPNNQEVAEFLYEVDKRIQQRGILNLKTLCNSTTWPAMVALRQGIVSRFEATPEKLEPILQAFRESLDDLVDVGLADAPRETIESFDLNMVGVDENDETFMSRANDILMTFKSSRRLPSFVQLVLGQLAGHWNESIRVPSFSQFFITWTNSHVLRYPYFEDYIQDQLAFLSRMTSATSEADNIVVYYVYMEVKKRLRHCFEDALDPNHELVLRETRNGFTLF